MYRVVLAAWGRYFFRRGRDYRPKAQSLGIVLGYRWTNMTFRKVWKIGGSDASRFRKATTSM